MFKILGRFTRPGQSKPEQNSGIPVESFAAHAPPMTIQQMVQKYVREAVSARATRDDDETFDEADDFEEEDPDTIPFDPTHHQVIAMDDVELRGIATAYGVELSDAEAPQEGASRPAAAAAAKPQPASQSGPAGSPGDKPAS